MASAARPVTVTVADASVADIDAVAERLRAAGMTIDQVLATVGIITGSVPAEQLAALETIEGVAAVEAPTPIQLPPPDADVQ
jgi:hypothetical protein